MRLRAVLLSLIAMPLIAVVMHAQPTTSTRLAIEALSMDPADVAILAGQISHRSEQLKPLFGQVHPADWVGKGAPDAYISQWSSLGAQNVAIQTDMALVSGQPEAVPGVMKALFRVHRFDSDLQGLLPAVRRYQDAGLADQIESVFAGDQRAIEKLQQYVLGLAGEKERLLELEDKEAQRCRSQLANQPIARPVPPKKNSGSSK